MTEERIDLTSLAAEADPGRWQDLVGRTMQQVDMVIANQPRSLTVIEQLAIWRPAMAIAAALTLLLTPLILNEMREIEVTAGANGLATITRVWATGGPPPTGALLEGVVQRVKP